MEWHFTEKKFLQKQKRTLNEQKDYQLQPVGTENKMKVDGLHISVTISAQFWWRGWESYYLSHLWRSAEVSHPCQSSSRMNTVKKRRTRRSTTQIFQILNTPNSSRPSWKMVSTAGFRYYNVLSVIFAKQSRLVHQMKGYERMGIMAVGWRI